MTIPNSVTLIESYAFDLCYSLTSVTIGNGVTAIWDWAFGYCDLTSLIIPDNVTSIGKNAFCSSVRLTEVYIPPSVTSIGSYAFDGCSQMTIYCEDGSYAHQYARGHDIPFIFGRFDYGTAEKVHVPDGKYLIAVVDPDGAPLPGVSVTYASQSGVTASDGKILFNSLTLDEPLITATLDGYITWSNRSSNWTKSSDQQTTIVLYPTSYGDLMLQAAHYKSGTSEVDLLTQTKRLNLKSDFAWDLTSGNFSITCSSLNPFAVTEYQLWQKNILIAKSADGQFSLNVDDGFEKGGGCFIRAVGVDRTADTVLNLTFVENEAQKGSGFSIMEGSVGLTIADEDIPFLGGSSFKVGGMDLLPLELKATDEKLYIGFNTKIWSSADVSDGEKKNRFESFKKDLATAMKYGNTALGKRDIDIINSMLNKSSDIELPGGKVKINVIGYAEANWGSTTATGELYIICKAETPTFGFTTWVVVVPVTANIKGSVELQAGSKISYNWDAQTLSGEFPLTLTLRLEAFGGVGVGKAVGVGAYGAGDAEFETLLFHDPFLQSINLTGELGVKAYLGPFEYEKPFAYNTWHVYTANTIKAYALENAAMTTYGLYDSDSYETQDLNYLSKESDWLGNAVSPYAAAASTVLTPLLTDTYRNARPSMIATEHGLMAVFLRADAESGEIYAVATKCNGTTWAEPVQLDEDAVLDGSPRLLEADDGTVWIAYARTTADASSSLLPWANGQSIVVGTLDPDTLMFTEKASYSGTGYLHDPEFAAVNGVPALVWAESAVTSEDEVLAPASNTICYAVWNGSTWSEATELVTINHPIWQLAVGESGVACNVDLDDNLATTDDAALILYTFDGDEQKLASAVTGYVTYGTLPGETVAAFLWNGDNCLVSSNGTTIPAARITGEYAVTDDRIYYSAVGETGAHLTTVLFDGTAWSDAVTLTGSERYLENLSVVTWSGRDCLMGMDTLATISSGDVDDAKNLVWAIVQPSSDLRLEGITYEADGLVAGDIVPVTLHITNAGDHPVTDLAVQYEGIVQTISCFIAPGETFETMWNLTCSDTLTSHTFEVYEMGMDDFTPEDNMASVSIGYADLAVELAEQKVGTHQALQATITNLGLSAAAGELRLIDDNGNVCATQSFDAIAPGDIVMICSDFALADGDYTASILCKEEELYSYNNECTIYVEKVLGSGIASLEAAVSGQILSVTLESVESGKVYCAAYDDDNQLLYVQTQTVKAGLQTVNFTAEENGVLYWKIFLLNEAFAPQCASVTINHGENQ